VRGNCAEGCNRGTGSVPAACSSGARQGSCRSVQAQLRWGGGPCRTSPPQTTLIFRSQACALCNSRYLRTCLHRLRPRPPTRAYIPHTRDVRIASCTLCRRLRSGTLQPLCQRHAAGTLQARAEEPRGRHWQDQQQRQHHVSDMTLAAERPRLRSTWSDLILEGDLIALTHHQPQQWT
jgi:hypothetical protein